MGVTPAYTPRPRRTQANCLRSALFLTEDGHSPFPAGLFDIVIEGRGTWAAARPAMLQDACLGANESSSRRWSSRSLARQSWKCSVGSNLWRDRDDQTL